MPALMGRQLKPGQPRDLRNTDPVYEDVGSQGFVHTPAFEPQRRPRNPAANGVDEEHARAVDAKRRAQLGATIDRVNVAPGNSVRVSPEGDIFVDQSTTTGARTMRRAMKRYQRQ